MKTLLRKQKDNGIINVHWTPAWLFLYVKLWLAQPLLLLWLSPQAFKSNHLLVFRLFLSFGSQNVPLGFHANCFTLFHTTSKVLRKGKSSV